MTVISVRILSVTGPLQIKVLFFGATRDAVGARSIVLQLPDGATTKQAVERLAEDYPALGRDKLLYAINEEYAVGDEQLRHDDELAIFTAVSGG